MKEKKMFKYDGDSHQIVNAVKIANDLVDNGTFRGDISECVFDMATCDGDRIVYAMDMVRKNIKYKNENFPPRASQYDPIILSNGGKLHSSLIDEVVETFDKSPLKVFLYKSKNPFSKAYGYFSPSHPDRIFLNSRRLNRSTGSIVGSLIHEMIHYLDHEDQRHTFGHGSNNPKGKQNTAPYFIGNMAKSITDGTIEDYNDMENSNIIYKNPWYVRMWNWIF